MLGLWLTLLGLSLVVGQKAGAKWFLKTSKNAAMAPVKFAGGQAKATAKKAAAGIWKRWKNEIMAFFTGFGSMKIATDETPIGFWILVTLGILAAAWLTALGIAHYKCRRYWFLKKSRDMIKKVAAFFWASHRSQVIWVGVGAIASFLFK